MAGMHVDRGAVRLSELVGQLADIEFALRHTEEMIAKSKPALSYKVTAISYSSPLMLELEPETEDVERKKLSQETVIQFTGGMRSILQKKELPPHFDAAISEAYAQIGRRVGKTISRLVISANGDSFTIPSSFQAETKAMLGAGLTAYGSIKGRMEAINLHKQKKEFRIYPHVGPDRVVCFFPHDLMESAIGAVNKYITVFGKLRYRARSEYPHEIDVDRIEIHPPDEELPSFLELKGIAPDMTGGLTSEDFIRKKRNVN
jgi:hypothetical protein